MLNKYICLFICMCLVSFACQQTYFPKPKAYPRVLFPKKNYQKYESPQCPFSFEYPTYAHIKRDSVYKGKPIDKPCWLNIYYPQFDGTIHISYETLKSKTEFAHRLEDAYQLAMKHHIRADYIDDKIIDLPKLKGMWYNIGGNSASALQLFLTDEEKHYLRAALYFNATPNIDSMNIVVDFVVDDLKHLVNTFKWK